MRQCRSWHTKRTSLAGPLYAYPVGSSKSITGNREIGREKSQHPKRTSGPISQSISRVPCGIVEKRNCEWWGSKGKLGEATGISRLNDTHLQFIIWFSRPGSLDESTRSSVWRFRYFDECCVRVSVALCLLFWRTMCGRRSEMERKNKSIGWWRFPLKIMLQLWTLPAELAKAHERNTYRLEGFEKHSSRPKKWDRKGRSTRVVWL